MNQIKVLPQFVQMLATYNFRTHFCNIAFIASGHLLKKVYRDDRTAHGIAKEFEPFEIHIVPMLVLFVGRTVGKCPAVVGNVFRAKPDEFVDGIKKNPVLTRACLAAWQSGM